MFESVGDTMASPTGRLAIALHFSVPPVAAVGLCYIFVVDKTFAIFKLLGRRLPLFVQNCLRTCYQLVNLLFLLFSSYAFAHYCGTRTLADPARLNVHNNPLCIPALSGLAFVRLCLLWMDRICIAFLSLPHGSTLGIKHRVIHVAILVASFSALSVDDPMAMLLLLQSYAGRATGSSYLEDRTRSLRRLFKAYAAALAILCVWTGRPDASSSRRSSGVALLAAIAG